MANRVIHIEANLSTSHSIISGSVGQAAFAFRLVPVDIEYILCSF